MEFADMQSPSIHFKYLRKDQEEMVKQWLSQDYVSEFWNGVGLENTLKSISQFVNGKEDLYTLWIAYAESTPFGYLMVSKVDLAKDNFARKLSANSKAITLDLLIGDRFYLGKGLGCRMIRELLLQKYGDRTDVFIDPEINNSKAIHVYEKVGFQKVEEFIPDWDPSCPSLLMHLEMKALRCND